MADDIVKEEHDVIDNPEVKTIFPEISVIKQEVKQEIVTSDIEEEQSSLYENPSSSQLHIEIKIEDLNRSPKREAIDDINQDYIYSTNLNNELGTSVIDGEQDVKVPGLVGSTPMADIPDFTDSSNRCSLKKSEQLAQTYTREATPPKKKPINRRKDIDEKNEKPLINKQYLEFTITESTPSTSMATDTVDITTHRQFTCGKCKQQFKSKDLLIQHESCRSMDDSTQALDMKSKNIKTNAGVKPFICVTCHKEFPKKYYLTRHMRIHTGEKPYACNMCDYKTRHHCNLKNHIRTHTGEKPYVCNICDYRCSQKIALTEHIRTHTRKKDYSCNICNKEYSQRGLANHMKSHEKEKPYACHICDYKFAQKFHLASHIISHTGEKPYSCDRSIFYDWKMK